MSRSQTERMLREYYEVMQKNGVEAADALFDAYETTGLYKQGGARGVNTLDRLKDLADGKGVGGTTVKRGLGYIDEAADSVTDLVDTIPLGKGGATASRMAASGVGRGIARLLPILGAATAVTDVGDIVFGQDSVANKAMDGTAMAIGGTIGAVAGLGNPLLAAAGASTGKFVSDGLQYLFGDKRTAEQRKMEEALAALQGRYI